MAIGEKTALADRIAGALYAIALGDSMGMPMEMFTRAKIRRDFGVPDRLMDGAPDNPISQTMKAGEVTDDTIMTFLTCEMLCESGGEVDARLLIRKIRAWAEKDVKSRLVIGPSTRAAFDKIDTGVPLEEAGRTGVTNGAAMKIAPIGFITRACDVDLLINRVHKLCMPTHNTSVAISGAAAVAAGVSLAVSSAADETPALDDVFNFALRCAEMGALRGCEVLSADVAARMRLIREKINTFDDIELSLDWIYGVIGSGLHTSQAVPSAFAVLMLGNAEPMRCARLAARLGGDTDTIGAISGAIAGAMRGKSAIPEQVRQRLTTVNGFDFEGMASRMAELRNVAL